MAAGLLLLLAVTVFGFWLARGPAPHWRSTTAKVVAIAPSDHRFHPNENTIVVRNATGTGEFTVDTLILKCDVGDSVPVEQAGVSLRAAASTCR